MPETEHALILSLGGTQSHTHSPKADVRIKYVRIGRGATQMRRYCTRRSARIEMLAAPPGA
eukprot:407357-Pleurochrysis_carterae.AAC.8